MNFSSAFASPLGLFPEIRSEFPKAISNEEFNLFHSIDRNLYSLLVQILGKLPLVSLHVMGFWLFLEHECKSSGLVKTLLRWPLNSINEVFNESLACLTHMHDSLDLHKIDDKELFFLSRLLQMSVSKMNFVENKRSNLSKIEVHVNHISRAFQNIPQTPFRPGMNSPHFSAPNEICFTNLRNGTGVRSMDYAKNGSGVFASPKNFPSHVHETVKRGDYVPGHFGAFIEKIDYPKSSSQHYSSLNKNSGEMVEEKQAEEVMAVDRTIFLTFSKGYPVTEGDVRDFFTRRFGDFIESIEMQEVDNGEPLFAKIVSKSIEMVDVVVNGSKAKYCIKNKHVCARKFIVL